MSSFSAVTPAPLLFSSHHTFQQWERRIIALGFVSRLTWPLETTGSKCGDKFLGMKTYYRNVIVPVKIEEDGKNFELKKDQRALTSEIREGKDGIPVVTVLSTYWVTLPASHFEGAEAAYGHDRSLFVKP